MVNYCCVQGCNRNSKQNKLLNYYSLPKERERQVLWLKAAHREDLLEKTPERLSISHRFCSRHFSPSSIKNRHLCVDAVPTLCLPGSQNMDVSDTELKEHGGVVCDSCSGVIHGFRYKCVTCPDYDLCMKCEMRETHRDHYMLRLPKPLKFKLADGLVEKWRGFFKAKHAVASNEDGSGSESNDDVPIVKYVIQKPDSAIDLPESVKKMITKEVARAITSNDNGTPLLRRTLLRKRDEEDVSNKRRKRSPLAERELEQNESVPHVEKMETNVEMEFADVNEVKIDHYDSVVKSEPEINYEHANTPSIKPNDNLRDMAIDVAVGSEKLYFL